MKHFTNSLFFYPLFALLTIFLGFTFLYNYSLDEAKETIFDHAIQNTKEDSFLLKGIIEELSLNKENMLIQREISRSATRRNTQHVMLISKNAQILYADRFIYIEKTLEEIFGVAIALHYKGEMEDKIGMHVHLNNSNQIDSIQKLNYLYNPFTHEIEPGYIIMLNNLSQTLSAQEAELREEYIQIYIALSLIVLMLLYLYYRNFLTKLLRLERISSQMSPFSKQNVQNILQNFSLDTIISRLTQSTKDLNIMSRVIKNSSDSIVITDENKNIIFANEAFEKMSGYSTDEVLGKEPGDLLRSKLMNQQFYDDMWDVLMKEGEFQGQLINRRKDGTSYTVWQTILMLKDQNNSSVTNYVAITKDISKLMEQQKEIENLAYYDGLTGLANRSYFQHLINKTITSYKRSKRNFALIYADLDDFKEINDTLGHNVGDKMLQHFAAILKKNLRSEDIICRLGGDEFAIITTDLDSPEDTLEIASKIIALSSEPLLVDGNEITTKVSIGISIFPNDGKDETSLLAAADLAMYRSKERGKSLATLFQEDMQKTANFRMQMRHDLKQAIINKEFVLYYQPKVKTLSQEVIGFEALIRWIHPTKGFMSPADFIPIAEESGLIVPITEWIFEEVNRVCIQMDALGKKFSIAINISAKHFKEYTLLEQVSSSIELRWLQKGCIEFEVTESAVMDDIKLAQEQLHDLKKLGIKVSLDDYGTGHSSLSYLKHLPIDKIKIDKSFVDGVPGDKNDCAIVNSVIQLARMLGMTTIAEGVETQQQALYLENLGADYIQGYFYYKPLKKEEAIEVLKQQNS